MADKITKKDIEKVSLEVWHTYGINHCEELMNKYVDEDGKINTNNLTVVTINTAVDISSEILFRVLNRID